jgi:hypothetical protein
MPWSTWRSCREGFDVAEPYDERASDPLGRELSGCDELPDTIPGDTEKLGRLGRTDQVAVRDHVRSAR